MRIPASQWYLFVLYYIGIYDNSTPKEPRNGKKIMLNHTALQLSIFSPERKWSCSFGVSNQWNYIYFFYFQIAYADPLYRFMVFSSGHDPPLKSSSKNYMVKRDNQSIRGVYLPNYKLWSKKNTKSFSYEYIMHARASICLRGFCMRCQ